MSPKKIQVGKTYINRGKGRTSRTVLRIGHDITPEFWLSSGPRPEDEGVEFEQNGKIVTMYLKSFATWAGKELEKMPDGSFKAE